MSRIGIKTTVHIEFPYRVKGPRRGGNPITSEVRETIFLKAAEGHNQADIAAHVGVNQGQVSRVLRGLI